MMIHGCITIFQVDSRDEMYTIHKYMGKLLGIQSWIATLTTGNDLDYRLSGIISFTRYVESTSAFSVLLFSGATIGFKCEASLKELFKSVSCSNTVMKKKVNTIIN